MNEGGTIIFVYILQCSDQSYYTGVTNDPVARVWQHQRGLIPGFTKNRRPVKLVYAEQTNDIGGAIFREKQIKRWSRKKKEALIRGGDEMLHDLARHYFRRHYFWGKKKKVSVTLSPLERSERSPAPLKFEWCWVVEGWA